MTLWMPWIDYAKSYRGVAEDLRRHWPAVAGCVASRSLSEPQRAMFEYFAGLLTVLGRYGWLVSAATSIGMTAGSYVIFTTLLKLHLPSGPLGF